MANNIKQFFLNYDMRQLVKSSEEYKNYMLSNEIQELETKIDLELTKIENDWNAFILIYKSLDKNKDEFTFEFKQQRDQQRQEQEKIITIKKEHEQESIQVVEQFREKLEMLKMSLKVYETKEEE